MNPLLKPAELLYRGLNRVRRSMYRHGILRSRSLPRPVISIGNIAAGGTGKTPLTIAVAGILGAAGLKVTILTRGYGRTDESEIAIVDGSDARRFGDEPVLLASRLPGATVVAGADRWRAGMWYLERDTTDVFLLDDGFQHLQLAREIDIVIDSPSAAVLREGRSALRDADLLVSRGASAGYGAALVPVSWMHHQLEHGLEALRDLPVVAFAGLAVNRQFFETLETLGVRLLSAREFPDHHFYSEEELAQLRTIQRESGAALLLTTEKDFVRIAQPDIAFLQVEMELDDAFRTELLERVGPAKGRGRSK